MYYDSGDLGLTVRRLAADAETTSQTIYTYFGSRNATIDAMYDRAVEALEALLGSLAARLGRAGDDPTVAWSDIARFYRQHCLAHPAHFKMLQSGRGPEGTDSARVETLQAKIIDVVGQSLVMATGREALVADSDGVRVRIAISSINGFIHAELVGFITADDLADQLFDKVLTNIVDCPAA